jgi:hypothetical protein
LSFTNKRFEGKLVFNEVETVRREDGKTAGSLVPEEGIRAYLLYLIEEQDVSAKRMVI